MLTIDTEKISAFWTWFHQQENRLYDMLLDMKKQGEAQPNAAKYPLLNVLGNRLRRVHKEISFEFALHQDEEKRFTFHFSANGNQELFPLIFALIDEAPSSSRFVFQAFKPAHPHVDELKNMALGHGEDVLRLGDLYMTTDVMPEGKLALDIYIPRYDGDFRAQIEKMFYILDKIIGEYDVATHIGPIDLHRLGKRSKLRPLTELPLVIAALKSVD